MITQSKLKEALHYEPSTGVFTRITPCRRVKTGAVVGSITSRGYLQIGVEGKSYLAHRLAWLYVHGYLPENGLDHIDRIRHHNCLDNLREVSQVCNLRNTGNHITNTSGIKGVSWIGGRGKWQAQIMVNGKKFFLGLHDDLTEAACHRLAAEQSENWYGCDSSSPAYKFVMAGINQSCLPNGD